MPRPKSGVKIVGQSRKAPLMAKTPRLTPGETELLRIYKIDDDPERGPWLDRLFGYMKQRGTPIRKCPKILRDLLDIYKLYQLVKAGGGYAEVTKKGLWNEIALKQGIDIKLATSATTRLRIHYCRTILPFECHFDRDGVDPLQVEADGRKPKSTGTLTLF
ncbi:AT-rich interactive domain-containing protein 3A-like [Drosophila willistoni]|uniref:GK21833 n=1 Tax=Drosophila willistoni TaxID=7260 RepID=B4MQ67_DROWI|nr:AT-rich interactive domain-containing protein 3A-like [Drosophila willistoni]